MSSRSFVFFLAVPLAVAVMLLFSAFFPSTELNHLAEAQAVRAAEDETPTDTTPPQILDIWVSTKHITTTQSQSQPVTVTVGIEIENDESGLSNAFEAGFHQLSSSWQPARFEHVSDWRIVKQDEYSTIYEGTLRIWYYPVPSVYYLYHIRVVDSLMNECYVVTTQAIPDCFRGNSDLYILDRFYEECWLPINDPRRADTTPPTITDVEISPQHIPTQQNTERIYISIKVKISDSDSGLCPRPVVASFRKVTDYVGGIFNVEFTEVSTEVSGDQYNQTWLGHVEVFSGAIGRYYLYTLRARDRNNKECFYGRRFVDDPPSHGSCFRADGDSLYFVNVIDELNPPTGTPTPTPTPTGTPTPTPSPSPANTATGTPTAFSTDMPTATGTPTANEFGATTPIVTSTPTPAAASDLIATSVAATLTAIAYPMPEETVTPQPRKVYLPAVGK